MQKSGDKEGIAAVHRAFELGLNYFDTAPHYGDGKSEQVRHLAACVTNVCAASRCLPMCLSEQDSSKTSATSQALRLLCFLCPTFVTYSVVIAAPPG